MDERQARELLRRFGQFADQFGACFGRRVQREIASQYLDGLFNDSERKSMQALHGRLSDPVSYQALQHFITDSQWEAPPLWQRLRALVPVRTGILALDDTSSPNKAPTASASNGSTAGRVGRSPIARSPSRAC